MLITEKGQVTIPIEIRERFGLLPHTDVEFIVEDEQVILKKLSKSAKRKNPFKNMLGKASIKMTTDEIMALTRGHKE